MPRNENELTGWALLIELCEDDCLVIELTDQLKAAVLATEKEVKRLHKLEAAYLDFAIKFL